MTQLRKKLPEAMRVRRPCSPTDTLMQSCLGRPFLVRFRIVLIEPMAPQVFPPTLHLHVSYHNIEELETLSIMVGLYGNAIQGRRIVTPVLSP